MIQLSQSLIDHMNMQVKQFDFNRYKFKPALHDDNIALLNELNRIFSVWMDLDPMAMAVMLDAFESMLSVCNQFNLVSRAGIFEKAQKQFAEKNDARGGACWIKSGIMGQVIEIQAKCERIFAQKHQASLVKDPYIDAWVDLVNYCRFGIVCCWNKRYTPIYSTKYQLEGDPAYEAGWVYKA